MLEIVTLGGGQHIVNVLNAVAAWCGGGKRRRNPALRMTGVA